jgi:hypothetical protein
MPASPAEGLGYDHRRVVGRRRDAVGKAISSATWLTAPPGMISTITLSRGGGREELAATIEVDVAAGHPSDLAQVAHMTFRRRRSRTSIDEWARAGIERASLGFKRCLWRRPGGGNVLQLARGLCSG